MEARQVIAALADVLGKAALWAASVAGGVWATLQIRDRLLVDVRVKAHPAVVYLRPRNPEIDFRRLFELGADPTNIRVVPRETEVAVASAQGLRDVPPAWARDVRPAMFVRI